MQNTKQSPSVCAKKPGSTVRAKAESVWFDVTSAVLFVIFCVAAVVLYCLGVKERDAEESNWEAGV